MSDAERIAELERRVRELEARPVAPTIIVLPSPPSVPYYPPWNPWSPMPVPFGQPWITY
jgi:hypothetical protein